jgi:chaperone modulatory protein CbpM
METDQLITTEKFCSYYNVEQAFVESLREAGLIETVTVQDTSFILVTHLHHIERMIRLHDDLDINPEGIGAIHTLLARMEKMQEEIVSLKNRIRFYEQNF